MALKRVQDMQMGNLLPPCEGPKLPRFEHFKSSIEFVKLLSEPSSDSDTSGGHGHVFEVRIRQQSFALKIVGCEQDVTSEQTAHHF